MNARVASILAAALAAVALALVPRVAAADDACAIKHGDTFLEEVAKSMHGKSCDDAATIARACMLGASGDVSTAATAVEICHFDFAKSADDQALFDKVASRCATKFAKHDGTLYRAQTAYCILDVAQLFSHLSAKVE